MAVNEECRREIGLIRRRMAMTPRGRVLTLQIELDRAAIDVAVLPHKDWARWTAYFVEVVDGLLAESHVSEELREEFLHRVAAAIADRLGEGHW